MASSSSMILALDNRQALYVFASAEEAQVYLEGIDVKEGVIEFCDESGQGYAVEFTIPPKVSKLGPVSLVEIGSFKLVAMGEKDAELPWRLVNGSAYLEHSSVPGITSREQVEEALRKVAPGD